MDYFRRHEESAYLEQPCYFQMNGCKYNEKLVKKPVISSNKGSMENFDYTSLFSSKPYSISSYIVGGFVGSKSQMNNNKHNLSYDLSAVIFNLLNPCKFGKEKSSVKKSNENNLYGSSSKITSACYEKYIFNKSSQKNEKIKECLLETMELNWLDAVPLQNIVSRNNYVIAINKHNKDFETPKTSKEIGNELIKQSTKNSLSENDEIIKGCDQEETNSINNTRSFCKTESEVQNEKNVLKDNILNENELVSPISKDSSLFLCDDSTKSEEEEEETDSECIKNSPKNSNLLVNNSILKQRFRQQSECSVESTDSESFIVFDENSEVCEAKKDCDEFWIFNNDDFESDDGGVDESSSSEEYDTYSAEKELIEANDKWLKGYQDVIFQEHSLPRKVTFNDKIKVNKIVAWDYAYRAARVGPWEQIARDRVRFRDRILRLSSTISPILEKSHRNKIYAQFYS